MTQRTSLENVHACVLTCDFLSVQRHPFLKPLPLHVDLSSTWLCTSTPPTGEGQVRPSRTRGEKVLPSGTPARGGPVPHEQ